ncbi:MAG: UMP kinase [Candidatus Edwardsbacteria bacterium RIFOXYD12_FULL_50_11]|jgi:uridylate kinase|uniref:Uridylate kinase n=1 Tax=Candidatus Edwardsbacteria bacterium GWF2_54_11 TaxID=1817851 RepID=A0A1F5R9X1_9BACT|nr:MAG: UMP kinase [Candidatus Edwardsbacteria bacterium RifOxyC12_full_54_24]OGF06622.1 MAG: UMP kinase [Candidatus Edwardsbacteria bacterium RifOxyA12_full_54_48]OGF11230.1 MAG: UMP kinase [Candidatus Edwardsbacteria bacterium GWF2_54_11]OGF11675.1 MAG: UMP kinase [Candidatus Edwardsbacteria bacterium GWE2_54_12]OGF17939.1 MAG: UMP kinase [Candidatus Edwardsbacteria bacterium RIFOXYD12_FULL_50_11]OGJ18440.1 MAG: UMP kinase [Candidatus Edwardsbacteria bacterium RifOxyB12_full_52_30]
MGGAEGRGIDLPSLERIADEVLTIKELGVSIGVVIGGGNLIRGTQVKDNGISRVTADNMGMLGTVINSLALQSVLDKKGCQTRVMSAVDMPKFAEPYIRRRALRHLDKGRVVIMAAGTGNPYFSTDTAAALRAVEMEAEVLLKGTKVDGVYNSDPKKDRSAKKYQTLSFSQVLADKLAVMDLTAVSLCMENHLPIIVFDLNNSGTLKRIIQGERLGTIVKE